MVSETKINDKGLPYQTFMGTIYHKYRGEKYFSRGTNRLHRVVWSAHNGEIPNGYHVHHKDGNTDNNNIGNLELVQSRDHLSHHIQERLNNPAELEKAKKHMNNAIEAAKQWHKSEEGRQWHSKHAKEQIRKEYQCTCLACGKGFVAKYKSTKFCSNNCKSQHRRDKGLDNETRICELCGSSFVTNKYYPNRFCSRSCATRYVRNK